MAHSRLLSCAVLLPLLLLGLCLGGSLAGSGEGNMGRTRGAITPTAGAAAPSPLLAETLAPAPRTSNFTLLPFLGSAIAQCVDWPGLTAGSIVSIGGKLDYSKLFQGPKGLEVKTIGRSPYPGGLLDSLYADAIAPLASTGKTFSLLFGDQGTGINYGPVAIAPSQDRAVRHFHLEISSAVNITAFLTGVDLAGRA